MKIFQLVLGATILVSANLAQAASFYKCDGKNKKWPSNSITAHVSSISFPSGSSSRSEILAGISEVNQNPSPFVISTTFTSSNVGNNSRNEVYATRPTSFGTGLASIYSHCYWFFGWHYGLDQVDVSFNADADWTFTTLKSRNASYEGSSSPIRRTMTHEGGHFLGLAHVSTEYNVMGDSWGHFIANGDNAYVYFGEDASDGAVDLYGAQSSNFEDVSASHWMYDGPDSNNEYSVHKRTRVKSTSGSIRSSFTEDGEPIYRVNRGSTYVAEFTIENNGKTRQTGVTYDLRWSTNDYISYGDTLLSSGTIGAVGRANAYTRNFTFIVPSTATSGEIYWLGVIVDSDFLISEVDGSNNRAYIGVEVQ